MGDDHGKHGEDNGGGHGKARAGGHGCHGGGHAEGEHEGAPEWLISFADNVALLMGFFVILLAMNMGPKVKGINEGDGNTSPSANAEMLDFVIAMREAFNNKVDINSKDPTDAPLIRRMLQRTSGKSNDPGPQGKNDGQQALRPTEFNRVTASVPFDDGGTTLSASARATLIETANMLRDQRWVIEVRGHVSPYEAMRNPVRAMELAHQRAITAATALVEGGLSWDSLRIVACGDNDRLVARPFDRDKDRTNQRVEIVVTDVALPPDPYVKQDEPRGPESRSAGAADIDH